MRVRKFRIGVDDDFVVYSSTLCVIGVEGTPPITSLGRKIFEGLKFHGGNFLDHAKICFGHQQTFWDSSNQQVSVHVKTTKFERIYAMFGDP